jgi:hypothetical protein
MDEKGGRCTMLQRDHQRVHVRYSGIHGKFKDTVRSS